MTDIVVKVIGGEFQADVPVTGNVRRIAEVGDSVQEGCAVAHPSRRFDRLQIDFHGLGEIDVGLGEGEISHGAEHQVGETVFDGEVTRQIRDPQKLAPPTDERYPVAPRNERANDRFHLAVPLGYLQRLVDQL